MARVFTRSGKWYVKYKDASGRWRATPTEAQTKTEAKHLAAELERKSERQRFGLEPMNADPSLTLEKLCAWWTATYPSGSPITQKSREYTLKKHVYGTDLGRLPLHLVTPGALETFLQSRLRSPANKKGISANSVNHLRGFLVAAFNAAKRGGLWHGVNPVLEVRKRRVP